MTEDPDSRSVTIPARSDGEAGIAIELLYQAGDWSLLEPVADLISRACSEIARDPALEPGELAACVALSTDERVRELNRTYRGQDKPTNVLSFPPVEPLEHGGPTFIGDIVIARETIEREATEMAIAPRDHLTHLVVHGLLHLMGFDHQSVAEAEEMEALETAILARMGIADPHAAELDAAQLAAGVGGDT